VQAVDFRDDHRPGVFSLRDIDRQTVSRGFSMVQPQGDVEPVEKRWRFDAGIEQDRAQTGTAVGERVSTANEVRFFRILGADKYLIHWLPQNLQQHQSPPRGSQTRVSARMAICTENAEEPILLRPKCRNFRSIRILGAPVLSEFPPRTFSNVMRPPEPDGAADRTRPGRTCYA
jgi:hypothetical protein